MSLETEQNELYQLKNLYSLSLSSVAEIHEKMKQIVKSSNRLYVISLNAMFASRNTRNDATGFVEVTALLRDFSRRLDCLVEDITKRINNLIFQSASMIKKKKLNCLLHQAVIQSDGVPIPESFILSNENMFSEIEKTSVEFSQQLARCERLIQIGESLAILAKIEAVASDDDDFSLTPITTDMTETIIQISERLLESRNIIAELRSMNINKGIYEKVSNII